MKDIKTFLIGFLMCACMFLIMGQTDSNQSHWQYAYNDSDKLGSIFHLFNSKTGKLISINNAESPDRLKWDIVDNFNLVEVAAEAVFKEAVKD